MGKPADPVSHNGRLVPALIVWSLFYAVTVVGALWVSRSPERLTAASAATIDSEAHTR
jgi:hypothetical protein